MPDPDSAIPRLRGVLHAHATWLALTAAGGAFALVWLFHVLIAAALAHFVAVAGWVVPRAVS